MLTHSHLDTVDATAWPGVATLPTGSFVAARARRAEKVFAKACAQAGIELDPVAGADIAVEHEELFTRLATSGWVGLAEGFMAGEWTVSDTDALVGVVESLIRSGYRPKAAVAPGGNAGGDVPPELVQHFAEDSMSAFMGHFATGVPTTERTMVSSYVPGAGRRNEPAAHYVDVTNIGAPLGAQRGDLAPAQRRSVEMLLDAARVSARTHVVEHPASGGLVAIEAARRRATVDVRTADSAVAHALSERLIFAGIRDAVHIEVGADATRSGGAYDAVISVEKLETLSDRAKVGYLRALGALIQPGGRVALQTVTRTPAYSVAADAAADSLRAYVWPGLSFATPTEIARIVDKRTNLRIIAETHAQEHLEPSLRIQRRWFDAHLREAAADGFDPVYRRLWQWQFAVREALARLGMIDLVQLTLVPRHRRGLR
ncbi:MULTISPECIES: class I SAM-dependent methyltransferase [unclassified Corynebacterium]|uniref:SAM-dependent methyltransferase n=1 Tax=unclassified Corynebacterium TaxID=2624378 RepID=UPI002A90E20C|nr:class I SAM-dependent methyltransferase [Corynebacterium sp.]MDY5784653.1 class I SAM-dependent methyltransferase [Corynebacterium sp.]